jgi:hypothetical protein
MVIIKSPTTIDLQIHLYFKIEGPLYRVNTYSC